MTFAGVTPLFAADINEEANAAAGAGSALVGILMMVFGFLVFAGMIFAYIMYFLTLSKALQKCDSRNRLMEPSQVWLNFIPCFNLVWIFITVVRVTESLKNEFEDRGIRGGGDYGKGVGITTYVLLCCAWIPFLNWLVMPAYLICWIIFWVKIAGLSKQLDGGSGDRRDDEAEDRPSRRGRNDEEGDRPSRRGNKDRDEDDRDDDDRPSRRRRDD